MIDKSAFEAAAGVTKVMKCWLADYSQHLVFPILCRQVALVNIKNVALCSASFVPLCRCQKTLTLFPAWVSFLVQCTGCVDTLWVFWLN